MRIALLWAVSLLAMTGCATKPLTCIPTTKLTMPYNFEPSEAVNTVEWDKAMLGYGDILYKHDVRQIFFVHGTFMGNDPFGIDKLVEITGLHKPAKSITDSIMEDMANYSTNYVETFCNAVSNRLCSENDRFTWRSGNTHEDRLDGAIKLADELANSIHVGKVKTDQTILLLRHSHAGQLFALLSHFLEGGEMANKLYKFINTHYGPEREVQLKNDIDSIKSVNLDFVTFGTPVRYSWGKYKRFRLLPIINHRSNSRIDGLLSIRDGDYVQQWGMDGSDVFTIQLPPIENELSQILKSRGDLLAFPESLKIESRSVPKYADCSVVHEDVLVDYKDNLGFPNIIESSAWVFGHGVYTTKEKMLLNTGLIVQNWYSP